MRKRTILISIIVLLTLPIMGQVNDPNFTPFAWGGCVGGSMCTAQPKQAGYTNIIKTPVAGFSFGGIVSFRKQKRYLETGLNYISEGYSFSSTVATNNTIKNQHNEYKFYSMMLPLRVVVPIQGFGCKHLPSLALNFSYSTKKTHLQTNEYENAPLTKKVYNVLNGYNKVTPSLTFAYGIEFDLDMNNALRFEAFLQYSIVNAKSPDDKVNISNFGVKAYYLFLR